MELTKEEKEREIRIAFNMTAAGFKDEAIDLRVSSRPEFQDYIDGKISTEEFISIANRQIKAWQNE